MEEGIQIGQYTFLRKIGEGGMAEVWQASHRFLGNQVAIKFLLPEFARNQELQERFLNEAKRQAVLRHPNIVPALDFFQADGRSYFVMQFVEGQSLDERLKKSLPPLTVDEVHSISWDVLSALDFAHTHGIVHRDVKPANMLVDRTGRVLLMDFGIAKALREERSMTITGTAMGTPDFMSPEQILEPKNVNPRSDIYSFGCVLYAMLAGDPPFGSEATSQFVIQERHVHAPPPPLVIRNPQVPAAVAAVVYKCLEKKPEDRYATCADVMTALNNGLGDAIPPAPPSALFVSLTTSSHPIVHNADPAPAPFPAPSQTIFETSRSQPLPPSTPQPIPPPSIASTAPASAPLARPRSSGKYIAIAAVMLLLIAAVVFWQFRKPAPPAPQPLAARVWRYNDDFSQCAASDSTCTERKTQAAKLLALSPAQWRSVRYDSPLLEDCMGDPPCEERAAHAHQLQTIVDWTHPDKTLLADCMDFTPCRQAAKPQPRPDAIRDPENLPDCCNGNQACIAAKKKENIPDCASVYGR